jgi:regulation of enolase protein 1 (concanavalin A-like superfamily)/chitodextrinase
MPSYRRRLLHTVATLSVVALFPATADAQVAGDEFDGGALNTSVWRVYDPVGDSSVSVASGRLQLALPAGVSHDLWPHAAWGGALRAPRVLRGAGNGDFEIEAKYDSAATQTIQGQGLVAQADHDDLVRFDVYSSGGTTKVFAATFVGGQPTVRVNNTIPAGAPLYLRMRRTGSSWTLRYSHTGTSWTTAASFNFSLALSEFGVFAINAGGTLPPAFTSGVDYFRILSQQLPPPPNEPPPDTVPPAISAVSAQAGASSATVAWTTDEPADSRVEYGPTTAYGESRSDATLTTAHSLNLTGLACETSYHYRVSSADANANRSTGTDRTFTTGACSSPPGGTAGDEFDGAALDTSVWRVHDPVGDSSVSVASGQLRLALPAGVPHDLWPHAAWGNVLRAPRVLRATGNGDFEIEAKYDTAVSQSIQGQGLVAQADQDDLVRFDVYSSDGTTKVFAATFVGGQPTVRVNDTIAGGAPLYLRMRRNGSTWTLLYSHTGTSWATAASFNFPLTLNEFGVFAANAGGSPPAFTSRVDYFRILSQQAPPPPPPPDTTPPAITAVAAQAGATSATVTWTTDEPADSRVEFGPTTGYGQSRSDATLATAHSIDLTGLACETSYHYRVSSADAAANRATGTDRTFTTGACSSPPGGGVAGDEFDGGTLGSAWRVYDPVGDSSVSVASGQLRLALPAGVSHDLWPHAASGNVLRAPRVLRAAGNGDFEIEAKYDTATSQSVQGQGLVAQADHDDLVRFDVYSSGGTTKVFAATFVGGQPTVRVNDTIPAGAPLYLRMRRSSGNWTLRYSHTGTSWTTAASFNFPLTLNEFGLFATNSGSPPPAFTSRVDYFRILSQQAPADTSPPAISGVGAQAGASSATVTWTTNEPADSRVEFGPTTAYGESRSNASLTAAHSLNLTGLACQSTYHYRVSSADANGNRATGTDRTFTTGSCAGTGAPTITVWHGEPQVFGEFGFPQRWLNVLGRADDPNGLSRVEYQLDNGPVRELVIDPAQNLRINRLGDFNVQIDRTAIAPGDHLLTLVAIDNLGNQTKRFVQLRVHPDRTWPLPYETDWASGLGRAAQIVDGRWAGQGDGIRTLEPGYDRTIALGAESWAGLDVTVPVTIHSFDLTATHSGIGLATGWRGHEGGVDDPPTGWPLGALCFYFRAGNNPHRMFIYYYERDPYTVPQAGDWIALGTPYLFRMKTEPLSATTSRYSCKVWRASDPEPSQWMMSDVSARRDGSVLLVADYADVTFGRVRVTP